MVKESQAKPTAFPEKSLHFFFKKWFAFSNSLAGIPKKQCLLGRI